MTNFDFLKNDIEFKVFTDVAISAEKVFSIDFETSVVNCRRAMEFAIKWLYTVDDSLVLPYEETLNSLMFTPEFKKLVGYDMHERLNFIRKLGNSVIHSPNSIEIAQAYIAFNNLFKFLDFIAFCYSKNYIKPEFKSSLLEAKNDTPPQEISDQELAKLLKENEALKEELSQRRKEQEQNYEPELLKDITEFETRKIYIDTMLADIGWNKSNNWIDEVEVQGMPNNAGKGFVDYVLYGDDFKPLAIIEAKKTSVNIEKGRHQAKLYADCLEQKHGVRPIIFLSNGFEHAIIDNKYPERAVSNIYSKRDLEKLFNLRNSSTSLYKPKVNLAIANRYYQIDAIQAVCEDFENNKRKALLVMATGSGKTRTVIALCDILLKHGFVKNILFLADRIALVKQAKKNFVNLLPNLSTTNLCEGKKDYNAACVFSTYQSMMTCIDEVKDEKGKLYTSGHFDLLICDEAHRSIYNKYKEIFTYFDAPLVGLTATPKDEVDKNTYEIFDLVKGNPTSYYELAQAVKDNFLVDYSSIEVALKFLSDGIVYDDLTDEEKEEFENYFENEENALPAKIESSALNSWVFNEDTIKQVVNTLMTQGLRVDYGNSIGKSIIFAKNHKHAEKILEVFNKEYPQLKDSVKVIDNYINYASDLLEEFSDENKKSQIAISVDMLDTGIDIPEILNLVFFKKVMSKAKFWQMIGRGTRLCPDLLDGEDKKEFYIFDFCNNFEFFRLSQGKESISQLSLQATLFMIKAKIAMLLQDLQFQTEEYIPFRQALIDEIFPSVQDIHKDNFAVKQHLRYIEKYSNKDNFITINDDVLDEFIEHIVKFLLPNEQDDEPTALRFDALMYQIMYNYLRGQKQTRGRNDLVKVSKKLANIANIPEIMAKGELINAIIHSEEHLENASLKDLEHIRISLRHLIKYIEKSSKIYETNFRDELLDITVNPPENQVVDLEEYKKKVEYYIREHQDNTVIKKLKSNIPLNKEDINALENILFSEVGTEEEYKQAYENKPLGAFVRSIVGLDMNAAKTAFAKFLDDSRLDSRQIHFVNQIIEYIVKNGMLTDFSVFQEAPFNNMGSIIELFDDDKTIFVEIQNIIEEINANIGVAV